MFVYLRLSRCQDKGCDCVWQKTASPRVDCTMEVTSSYCKYTVNKVVWLCPKMDSKRWRDVSVYRLGICALAF